MTRYEQRLERDLAQIKKQFAETAQVVEAAIANGVRAVLTLDRDLATNTILGDYAVNRLTRDMDRLCHTFVARHLPSAGHLRFVSSVLRLGIALERIGDYAATISRSALQLSTVAPQMVARDIEMMVEHACRVLHDASRSFNKGDVALARDTLALAARLMPTNDKVVADLIREGEQRSRPVNDLFGLMATLNRLERVIHQAKNVCEETLFTVAGESKDEKVFEVLFLDERNEGASQLAEQVARKAYPESGRYRSAGWNPAQRVDPAYVGFGDQNGFDLRDAWPASVQALVAHLGEFNIVVDMDGRGREQLGAVPFHTVVVRWGVDAGAGPAVVHKQVAPLISELMERLRGANAR